MAARGLVRNHVLDPRAALCAHYQRVARTKFDGLIPRDFRIEINPLLRRLTGRISYRERLIEIAQYHLVRYGLGDAIATLEHELLHLYLHTLGLPSGHTKDFRRLAAKKGIRVFHANPYPRNRAAPTRCLYECPACGRIVSRMRRSAGRHRLACGPCCRAHAAGAWDRRFELAFVGRVRMA
jgi:predicted SprT family Zn-dependent metalloprotease